MGRRWAAGCPPRVTSRTCRCSILGHAPPAPVQPTTPACAAERLRPPLHFARDARVRTHPQMRVPVGRGQRCGHINVPASEPRSRPGVDASGAPCARLAVGGGARVVLGGANGSARVNGKALPKRMAVCLLTQRSLSRRSPRFRRPSRARFMIAARGQIAPAVPRAAAVPAHTLPATIPCRLPVRMGEWRRRLQARRRGTAHRPAMASGRSRQSGNECWSARHRLRSHGRAMVP
jgi:hypothetical protein